MGMNDIILAIILSYILGYFMFVVPICLYMSGRAEDRYEIVLTFLWPLTMPIICFMLLLKFPRAFKKISCWLISKIVGSFKTTVYAYKMLIAPQKKSSQMELPEIKAK